MTAFSVLILAGGRGPDDPVAASEGLPAKALVPVAGVPMLARVIAAVRAAGAGRVAVAASDPAVAALAQELGCELVPAAQGPSESAARGFALLGAPMLLTTADHALLQPAWVADFRAAVSRDADVSVLLARRDVVEAAVPETQRTWLRFADGQWSGCNLFHFATPRAAAAFALWQAVERDRKRPWRIVWRLGPLLLLRYALGRLSLTEAMATLGGRAGLRVEAVASPHGLAAVDVDKPADLVLARRIAGRLGPT
ncbi:MULTISPECIES: NTP transferase domain-containing protein [unclassified Novosphingobium]|uniref:NTP transferase domain-containing protein n=1 Tax=unclassified Novosphingobium TaxID=2644732 RepID=UPI000D30A4A6|nr:MULTISPECIES: NTP transferase domain-containing protein [unclassified Novosphingobium]PTR11957.1 MobA-like NTP transferase protein [Novosphingobium sp. GV055]PUB04997.1 MobA-like NTP transferase protein [Novosphingobium sp. GV061]PUB21316.1 MobA-like NTP transferase protein [Novosphingobium sp. GV079]PUB43042.1 MobA-like NTP transferase protein [Novosphingobium sp. GV027]